MTHTAEPMTLEQISDAMGEKLRAAGSYAKWTNLHHAIFEWREVIERPLRNVHRRSLDDAWRQVIRHFGGDDVVLCGPRHDDLLAAAPTPPKEK